MIIDLRGQYWFQLLDQETGRRSKAICGTAVDFAKTLAKRLETSDMFGRVEYVIMLCRADFASEDWDGFSIAPLLSAESFVAQFLPQRKKNDEVKQNV